MKDSHTDKRQAPENTVSAAPGSAGDTTCAQEEISLKLPANNDPSCAGDTVRTQEISIKPPANYSPSVAGDTVHAREISIKPPANNSPSGACDTVRAQEIPVRKQKIRKNTVKIRLIVFGTLACLLILGSIFSEHLCPYDPYLQDLSNAKAAPSPEHLFGTDRYGRDMLSRVIVGSRTSIFSTLLLVAIITVIGTMVGVFCGWHGKKPDAVLMRISDIFLAFPGLVFALAVAGVLGGGLQNAVIALAAISWPKYARIARSQTLSQKETAYLKAARMAGSGTGKIIFKHILPNIIGPILVTSMLDIGTMMMELAGLSFLGLGAKPPAAEWGSMMSDSRSMMATLPWLTFAPGLAIFISVMIFNLLGDTIRDYADPRTAFR